ncbi:MAG: ATP synthase F1 subunit epsilon [Rickettsiales bacterium]|nr:MAG: ATP synthase F1 subunit epsilon [Rickettsiales bacterium]
MSNTILVKIILPAQMILETEADMVNIPGSDGMFGVLPGHAKLTSGIDIGVITLVSRDFEQRYFVYGGVAQVTGEELNIITEFAVDLDKTNKVNVLDNITNLKSDLSDEEVGSVEANIIAGQIERYETLLKFI